jgi:hypothetical protein
VGISILTWQNSFVPRIYIVNQNVGIAGPDFSAAADAMQPHMPLIRI